MTDESIKNSLDEAFNQFVDKLTTSGDEVSKAQLNNLHKNVNKIIKKQMRRGYDVARYMPKDMLVILFEKAIIPGITPDQAFSNALLEYNENNPEKEKSDEWMKGKGNKKGAKHLTCIYIPEVTEKSFSELSDYSEMESLNIINKDDVARSETPYKAVNRITRARTLYDGLKSMSRQIERHEHRIQKLEKAQINLKEEFSVVSQTFIDVLLNDCTNVERQSNLVDLIPDINGLIRIINKHCDRINKSIRVKIANRIFNNEEGIDLYKEEVASLCKVSRQSIK